MGSLEEEKQEGVTLPLEPKGEEKMVARLCPYCHAVSNVSRTSTQSGKTTPGKDRTESQDEQREISLEKCQNCEAITYVRSGANGLPVYDSYPRNVEHAPAELPESVKKAFEEALVCFSAGAPNGALLMCRRAIQETMNDKKAKKGDLPIQLDDLVERRILAPTLRDWAKQAQIGGKIAAHGTGGNAWGDPDKIWGTQEDATAVIDYCRGVFDYLYVLEERNRKRMEAHKSPASQSEQGSNAP